MLNEVPSNNVITNVANIVLNEAPNSNDTMNVTNNVHLTTMGAQQLSMAVSHHAEKLTYQRREIMTL